MFKEKPLIVLLSTIVRKMIEILILPSVSDIFFNSSGTNRVFLDRHCDYVMFQNFIEIFTRNCTLKTYARYLLLVHVRPLYPVVLFQFK